MSRNCAGMLEPASRSVHNGKCTSWLPRHCEGARRPRQSPPKSENQHQSCLTLKTKNTMLIGATAALQDAGDSHGLRPRNDIVTWCVVRYINHSTPVYRRGQATLSKTRNTLRNFRRVSMLIFPRPRSYAPAHGGAVPGPDEHPSGMRSYSAAHSAPAEKMLPRGPRRSPLPTQRWWAPDSRCRR